MLFVGQAPGKVEDKTGQCFTGPAGDLLTDVIELVGLDSVPYRFENTCRCAPPRDRKPRTDEVEACIWRVWYAITQYKPKVIVPLGDVALRALTKLRGVEKYAGRPVWQDGLCFFPTIHPSAVLHRPRKASEFESQFYALARFLKRGDRPKVHDWKLLTTSDEIEAHYEELMACDGPVAFDFETTGLDPARCQLRCVAFCNEAGRARAWPLEAGGPIPQATVLRAFDKLTHWAHSGRLKLAHTATFESKWCEEKLGAPLLGLIFDTKLVHHLLHELDSHHLSQLAELYTDFGGYDDEMKAWVNAAPDPGTGYATAPLTKLAIYCCGDVDATYQTMRALEDELRQEPERAGLLRYLEEYLLPAVPVVGQMEQVGIAIDRSVGDRLRELIEARCDALESEMRRLPDVGRWWRAQRRVKLGHYKDVARLLFDCLGLKTSVRTSSGRSSTDGDALEEMKPQHLVVPLIQEWRSVRHLTTKINELERYLRPDGTISPTYQMAKAVTWRLAAQNPQVHNIPITKLPDEQDGTLVGCRSMVVSRYRPDGVLLEADYRQLEIVLMAELSGDEALRAAVLRGDDLHTDTAARVFDVAPTEVTKSQRAAAKAINFGINYGEGAAALARKLRIPQRLAEEYLEDYWAAYPGIKAWIEKQHRLACERGYVTNPLGCVRRLPDAQEEETAGGHSAAYFDALRQAQNFPITSTGAGLTLLAMTLVAAECKGKALLVNQNHDALLLDLPRRHVSEVAVIVRQCMTEEVPRRAELEMPLSVEIAVGENWGTMKPYKE